MPEIQLGMGWGGRAEKIILIFEDGDRLRDLADDLWSGSRGAEASAKVNWWPGRLAVAFPAMKSTVS